ncbi:PilZ domain-containing protein [Anaeromyxobacter oryzae]|uniref:PilZ domain-containing protein n=1 Tax=Anaeromyxobacter oryzae TaxID=2918170 RepID=A0ABM7WXL9_9BACT|nr:PilZ domain-containing protein [Anaeromyxobacter oryzae]BDG04269.1 hypothetical protein AMOR_32650 [Anaeromyxobacter oryzae]
MGDRSEGRLAATARAIAEEPQAARDAEADRRDSQRVPLSLLVREPALGGSFEPHTGNLSLGGVFFEGLHPPVGSRLEVRFLLPHVPEEVRAVCEVLRVTREGPRFGAHLRFVEIPLDAELAVARFLQQR